MEKRYGKDNALKMNVQWQEYQNMKTPELKSPSL
jgi:hypothetical protein